jgi:hypothetical protein
VYAHASIFEFWSQLQMMQNIYADIPESNLIEKYDLLVGKTYNFIKYLEKYWKT